jgi:hypothetical protein
MLDTFEDGLLRAAQGNHDTDDDSAEAAEYRALDKMLCWSRLQLPAHMVRPLDPMLDGPMPE